MTLDRSMLLKKISILDFTDNYTYWLIFKFTPIAKRTRLIPKQLAKINIEDDITA